MKRLFTLVIFLTLFFMSCTNQDSSTITETKSPLEEQIDSILAKMSLTEKIGQTAQRGTSSRVNALSEEIKQAIREGRVGSMINVMNTDHVRELQKIAIEESPNKIPLIFARDVIHGFKTIFPIPLGQAATWNPSLVQQGARTSAIEASTSGVRWTFAPMLDIARDARWGRIAESPGEDPYLASVLAKAYTKGFQDNRFNSKTSLAACGKHFVGYGAGEGGRDYNTAVINDELLHNVYLKPFKTASRHGIATYMSSFNELNGIPASGNKYVLKEVLRNQWKFDGFVVSDWNSVTEMIPHGYCKDEKEAAEKAFKAGLDMEMMSQAYEKHIEELLAEGVISESDLDEMVRNILRVKFRLGLFKDASFEEKTDILYHENHLAQAKQTAMESMVLLKNKNSLLPLNDQKIALIGPLANAPHEQLGTWTFDGEKDKTITVLKAFQNKFGERITYSKGLEISRDKSTSGFKEAIKTAKKSDVIVFVGGEEAILSGEAHSRANIDLPGTQEQLIQELAKTGKPIVLVIMAGRPITIGNILNHVDAVVMAWHPGTMGGPALADILDGTANPSGRLPISWPKTVGQIPVHYNHKNTGRPANKKTFVHIDSIPVHAWQSSLGNTSHYLDDGFTPLFPFGYGLSYSEVLYSDLRLSTGILRENDSLFISFNITNKGDRVIKETTQLYFQDEYASITRPVKELVRFKQVNLEASETKNISFSISKTDLKFYNSEGKWVTEPGSFKIWIGPNSSTGILGRFEVE